LCDLLAAFVKYLCVWPQEVHSRSGDDRLTEGTVTAEASPLSARCAASLWAAAGDGNGKKRDFSLSPIIHPSYCPQPETVPACAGGYGGRM
jgi:hypothetical protein